MTGPRPLTFDRAWAKQNGYTDGEIDEYLAKQQGDPLKPTTPRIASESTQVGPGQVATPEQQSTFRQQDLKYAKGLGRQAAQGASFGFADEIEAGARSTFGPRNYRDVRDEVRGENSEFARENPGVSLAANIAGGVATGGGLVKAGKALPSLARMLQFSGLTPSVSATATGAQRFAGAVKAGTAAGALGGAGVAEERGDMLSSAGKGAVIGGATGALFAGAAAAMKSGRNVVAGLGQGDKPAGPIRRFLQAESPEEMGNQRALRTIGRAGQSLDELEAASNAAPRETALAELVPNNQGVRGLRIARNVGRERDVIDESLSERAAEEPANWSRTISRETGVAAPRDTKAFTAEVRGQAKTQAAPLYQQTEDLPVPDGAAATLLDEIKILKDDGLDLWRDARASDKNFPKEMTDQLTVRQMQRLRQALDNHIEYGKDPTNRTSIQNMAQGRLSELRAYIDDVTKSAGGAQFQEADAIVASAANKGRSFDLGTKVDRQGTAEGVQRLTGEAGDPEAFRQGAASRLLERAAGVADGEGGQIRNPVAGPLGSETKRAQTRAAFPDEDSFTRARGDAEAIVGRLKTRNQVSGNSTTAANLSEMADEFMDNPGALVELATKPAGALRLLGEKGWRAGVQGLNAQQATQMGRVFGAGLPGQMTREETIAMLKRMEPMVIQQLQRQMATRGAAGSLASRSALGQDR